MAGLGQVCTHVGAVRFFLEASAKISSNCTQEKYKWVIPSYQREVPFLPVRDVDFTLVKGKQKRSKIETSHKQVLSSGSANMKAPDHPEL